MKSTPILASNNLGYTIELTEKEIKILKDEVPSLIINEMNTSEKINFYDAYVNLKVDHHFN